MTPTRRGWSEKALHELGAQQRSIVESVWRREGATVREVWDDLSPERTLAYTSVLSAMQALERSGWLCHERSGRCHVYRVTCSRAQARLASLRKIVDEVFAGDESPLEQHLLASGRPGFATLRDLVDSRRAAA